MSPSNQSLEEDVPAVRRWPTYLGITGLLLVLVVVLAGGIIWYDTTKASQFAIASARQLIKEVEKKVIDRVKLLYDPMFAIVGVASMVPELTTASVTDEIPARALMLRALRIYPQILSIYVGFDSGDFLMVTHLADPATAFGKSCKHRKMRLSRSRLSGTMPPASARHSGFFSPKTARKSPVENRRRPLSIRANGRGIAPPGIAKSSNAPICTCSLPAASPDFR